MVDSQMQDSPLFRRLCERDVVLGKAGNFQGKALVGNSQEVELYGTEANNGLLL